MKSPRNHPASHLWPPWTQEPALHIIMAIDPFGFQRTQQSISSTVQLAVPAPSLLLPPLLLACPAHFNSCSDHLFYQILLVQIAYLLKSPCPRRLGATPAHLTSISFSSLCPVDHSSLVCLGTQWCSIQVLTWDAFWPGLSGTLGLCTSTWVFYSCTV